MSQMNCYNVIKFYLNGPKNGLLPCTTLRLNFVFFSGNHVCRITGNSML